MSSILGKLAVSIVGQMDDLDKTFKKASKEINKFAKETSQLGADIGNLGKNMTAFATAPILALGAGAIKLASDLNEVQNVVDVTFGKNANQINTWAKSAMDGFGITELQAKKMNGTMGAMLKSMKLSDDESLNMSTSLTGLAGDFASFYNLDHDAAFDKIRSGISGETEPLKQLGINMSVANLEAFALSQGIKKPFDEMAAGEQTQLRYNFLMNATKDAQGDFNRTSDGFANQLRIMQGEMSNLGAELGQILLPYALQFVQAIRDLVGQFTALDPGVKTAIIAVAGIVAVLGPVLMIVGALVSSVGAIAGAWAAFTASLAATPAVAAPVTAVITGTGLAIAGMVAAVGVLIVAIVDLWRNNEEFRNNLISLWKEIASTVTGVCTALKAFWDTWGGDITASFKSVWDLIKTIVSGAVQLVTDIIRVALAVIRGDWAGAWEAVQNLVSNAWTNIGKILFAMVDSVKEIGSLMIQGLINGIKAKFEEAKAAVKWIADSVTNTFKKAMGIQSPSRVFMEMGQFITQGLAQGVTGSSGTALDAINQLGTAMLNTGDAISTGIIERVGNTNAYVYNATYGLVNNQIALYFKERDARISNIGKASDAAIKAIDKEISATSKAFDIKSKLISQEYNARMALIDLTASEEIRAKQNQIDAISEQIEAEQRAREEADYKSSLSSKKDELSQATDPAAIARLRQEISDMEAEYARQAAETKLRDQQEALRDEIDNIRSNTEAKKADMQDELDAKLFNIEQQKSAELAKIEELKVKLQADLEGRKTNLKEETTVHKAEKVLQTQNESAELKLRETQVSDSMVRIAAIMVSYAQTFYDAGSILGASIVEGIEEQLSRIRDSYGGSPFDIDSPSISAAGAGAGISGGAVTNITINVSDGVNGLKRELGRLGVRMP